MAGEPILVVDDNPENLKLARLLLKTEGYSVTTAMDAEQAMDQIRRAPPRLILMDIQLPGMDGLELTARIKADPKTRNILVIAVTAYAMKGDEAKVVAAGCDGYASKPIDIRGLPRMISNLLAGSEKKTRETP
jgi:two-component system cell cycle response regulator